MPLIRRSLTGKIDLQAELTIRELSDAVDSLEGEKGAKASAAALATGIDALNSQLVSAQGEIAILRRRSLTDVTVQSGASGSGTPSSPIDVNVDGVTIIINENNQLEVIDVTNVTGAGGGHLHGLMRTLGDGATDTFELDDIVDYLEHIAVDGAIVDPTTFSLSADGTQLIFDTPPGAGLVIAIEYVIAGI